jgi:hypothetical protein
MEFVKICSKGDSQIRAQAAERKSRGWAAGSKKQETMSNTISAPEVAPAGRVAGYHCPTLMDPSAVKEKKIAPNK